MAALDFPSSPTLNQQYAAPNGVTYQWDGAAWIVTGGPPGQLWTASGSTLVPTDVTKTVSVPGGASGVGYPTLILGSSTGKSRLITNNTLAAPAVLLATNKADWTGTQDDATKSSWVLFLNSNLDSAFIQRQPPGSTTAATLVQIDNAGSLTSPSQAGTGSLVFGPAGSANTTRVMTPGMLSTNSYYNAGWQRDDTSKPGWALQVSYSPDQFQVLRNGGSGLTTIATINGASTPAGDLQIMGNVATKNTGTVWINPSDIRLKRDVTDYARGLAEILQLQPIRYTLKACGTTTCGFDAEAVRRVFPECISETRMKLSPDDAEETDGVLVFDMHPILVALVNAVKELAATPTPPHA
jgi:hypothetical protein